MMNQRQQVLQYLSMKGFATIREMIIDLNMNSPWKRISELIKLGYPIGKSWQTYTNEYGETKRYVIYHWLGEKL